MSDSGKTYKYKFTDGNHLDQLTDVFSAMVNQQSDVSIVAMDNHQIQSNRKFLSMFSTSLRDILGNIPEYISPTIILPDCAASSINHLLKIITGKSIEFDNYEDWRAMLKTAGVLGVEMETDSLIFLKSPKQEPMECDEEEGKIPIKQTNNVTDKAPLVSSKKQENAINKEVAIDSGINSFLETSSSIVSSTPKPKPPPIKNEDSQDIIKSGLDFNKDNDDVTTVPLQPHQIKLEIVHSDDVSPKELIAKQAVHRICQVPACAKNVPSLGKLRDHYLNHFWDEFVRKYSKFVDDKICLLCSKVFGSRSSSLKHLAIWHSKINELLTSKNYLPLPLQLNIKDLPEENEQSVNMNLPVYKKEEAVESTGRNKVENLPKGATPSKSAMLDRSMERAKKNVSFDIERHVEKIKPINTKVDTNQVSKSSESNEISVNSKNEARNEMEESVSILYDNVQPNKTAISVKQEPLEAKANNIKETVPISLNSIAAMKPHEIKKELFEFDNNVVPKDIITEQSVHKVCQVCRKPEPVLGKLRDHYVGHFFKEIEERYGKFVDDKSCTFCIPPKPLSSRSAALRHIATWHSKVNSILTSKNLLPLPLTLNIKDTDSDMDKLEDNMGLENSAPGQHQSLLAQNFQCQLCNQNQKSFSALRYHFYQKHFKNEVNSKFGHLAEPQNGRFCLVCKDQKDFKNRQATMNHIALIHSKINEVINDKGLKHLLEANPWVGGNVPNQTPVQNPPPAPMPIKVPEQQNKTETLARTEKNDQAMIKEKMAEKIQTLIKLKENAALPVTPVLRPAATSEPESKTKRSLMPNKEVDQQKEEMSQPPKVKTADEILTEEFLIDRFLTKERTKSISEKIDMTETEIWKWFYNARKRKSEEMKAKLIPSNDSIINPKATKAILTPDNGLANTKSIQSSEYSESKEMRLKNEFYVSRHLNKERTRKIATEVKLSEEEVEKWFSERSKLVPPNKTVAKQNTTPGSFTTEKIKRLNSEFSNSQDLSRDRIKSLAQQLRLSEKMIIQWFTTKTRSTKYNLDLAKESQTTVNKSKGMPQGGINKVKVTPQMSVNKPSGTPQMSVNKVSGITPMPVNKTIGTPQISVNKTSLKSQYVNKTNVSLQNPANKSGVASQTVNRTPQSSVKKSNLTINQLLRLEKEFANNRLKTREMRKNVADGINLTEKDIEQWLFKNKIKQIAQKRSAENEANKEVKRGKIETRVDKVIKTENDIKTEKDTFPESNLTSEIEKKSKKVPYSCNCGESFLSDEAFGIHKTYTCKNIS